MRRGRLRFKARWRPFTRPTFTGGCRAKTSGERSTGRMRWFAESDPPAWCRPENLQPSHAAVMSAYKFDPRTIRLLQQRGWAREVADDSRRLQMMTEGRQGSGFDP